MEVYYKTDGKGHFFWSHDKRAKGLLVSDVDVSKAVAKVTEVLKRHTNLIWEPGEKTTVLMDRLEKDTDGNISSLFTEGKFNLPVSWIGKVNHDAGSGYEGAGR